MRRFAVILISCALTLAAGCGPKSSVSAEPETVLLSIEGMTCEGCVSFIAQDLAERPGVEDVAVSLEEKQARLLVLPNEFNLVEAALALQKRGYTIKKQ